MVAVTGNLEVEDVRPFMPARDFERSAEFYSALGWSIVWTDNEGLALMELGGCRLMLQDFYVRQWAENFVISVVVSDAAAWFERVATAIEEGDYGDARVESPRSESWGAIVTYAWDPSGVLLHFTQFT